LVPPLILLPLVLLARGTPALVPADLATARRPILFVAHPDDECLFFSPAVLGMRALHAGVPVGGEEAYRPAIVVMSSAGNNYGMGETRRKEMMGSCEALGVVKDRCVVLDEELKDNPTQIWNSTIVGAYVKKYVAEFQADAIITFDDGGVSGHLNHKSVYWGIRDLVQARASIPPAFSSTTVWLLRKYSSIHDITWTALAFLPRMFFGGQVQDRALFLTTWSEYLTGRRAFFSHASQVGWDRHPYMVLSRYMMMNDLRRI
ncbi:putative deacetylase LmbE-like domain-containing protein, partial [Blyttiomyces helicus]